MSDNRPTGELPHIEGRHRIAIVTAEWNADITHALRDGAIATLLGTGIPREDILTFEVPGAIELTYAASMLTETMPPVDAVIVFGCVIRGDTPHFDYVCQSVTQGITAINTRGEIPVIFGVLTVENQQQAIERVGGCHGHKGIEAAEAAIQMIALTDRIASL